MKTDLQSRKGKQNPLFLVHSMYNLKETELTETTRIEESAEKWISAPDQTHRFTGISRIYVDYDF